MASQFKKVLRLNAWKPTIVKDDRYERRYDSPYQDHQHFESGYDQVIGAPKAFQNVKTLALVDVISKDLSILDTRPPISA